MAINYSKRSQNKTTFSIPRPKLGFFGLKINHLATLIWSPWLGRSFSAMKK
jgi:hypothetical protein